VAAARARKPEPPTLRALDRDLTAAYWLLVFVAVFAYVGVSTLRRRVEQLETQVDAWAEADLDHKEAPSAN
jgi:hypothetical protein